MTFRQWLEKNNISDGNIYIVTGGNTFEIKDKLKEAGARYHHDLGWFFGTEAIKKDLGLPEGFYLFHCEVENVLEWDGVKNAYVKEDTYDEIKNLHKLPPKEPKEPTELEKNSQFYGKVGDRLRKVDAIFKSARWISNDWGGSYLYVFEYQNNIFIWFSQSESCALLEKDAPVTLSGTIKDHKDYNGVKQTYLSRCIVKER